MTYKDDARNGRIKMFIMAVDPNAILDLNPNNGNILTCNKIKHLSLMGL